MKHYFIFLAVVAAFFVILKLCDHDNDNGPQLAYYTDKGTPCTKNDYYNCRAYKSEEDYRQHQKERQEYRQKAQEHQQTCSQLQDKRKLADWNNSVFTPEELKQWNACEAELARTTFPEERAKERAKENAGPVCTELRNTPMAAQTPASLETLRWCNANGK